MRLIFPSGVLVSALALAFVFSLAGCLHVTMDVNANVNVNVKLDKALDDYFNELDKADSTMNVTVAATPAPATTPEAAPAPAPLSQRDTELRTRARQHQAQVDAFKASGALGENNLGFLEVRDNQEGAAALAATVNADRKTMYQGIASRQNVSVEEVGKTRARHIAQRSKPGVWIQDAQGEWAKKK